MHEFSSYIPFEKSILGISLGFTILLNIYCTNCIDTSDDGIKNIIIDIKYTHIFLVNKFIIPLIPIDISNVNIIFIPT